MEEILGISILCCYCCCCCRSGRKKKPETDTEGTGTAREGFIEGTDAARGKYRGRKSGTLDAIKLERIGVKEEQRQKKLEREVEDTLVKAIQKAKVGSPEQRDLIAQ